MLSMGKNPYDQEDNEHKQDATPYGAPRSYGSYQKTDTQAKSAPESPATPRALTEHETTLAHNIKEGTFSGFVGSGTIVTGETTFKAMLRIDGQLSGRISSGSGTLTIGSNGKVDANIEVAVAIIHGTVNGGIVATRRLEFGRTAKVYGNIQTQSLVIEQGAIFEGICKMAQKGQNHHDQPLVTIGAQPISTDEALEPPAILNVLDTAS